MSSLIITENEKTKRDPIPESMYHAVCYSVVDLGTQDGGMYGAKRKAYITFEIPALRVETKRDGESKNMPVVIGVEVALSLSDYNGGSALFKLVRGWLGAEALKKNSAGLYEFDIMTMAGRNAFINVVNKPSKKDPKVVYSNIQAVSPVMAGTPLLEAENPLVKFALPIEAMKKGEMPVIDDNIPDFLRKKIMDSQEMKALESKHSSGYAKNASYKAEESPMDLEDEGPF